MSSAEIVIALIKIAIVLVFMLAIAGLGSWADRRQSAMIQDRVGPNRATAYIPSNLARLLVLLPPSILGGIALLPLLRGFPQGPRIPADMAAEMAIGDAAQILPVTTQLAVFVAWFSLLVLSGVVRRGEPLNKAEEVIGSIDPRTIFYAGVVAHAVAFLALGTVPKEGILRATQATGAVLAAFLFIAGIYAASRVPDGPIAIRAAGTLHILADTLKSIWKEDFIPKNADRLLHSLAPIVAMFPTLVTMAVVPFGDKLCVGNNPNKPLEWSDFSSISHAMPGPDLVCRGHVINLQIADLNVGILYIFAMAGTGVVGAALAGWASDNKWSLLGGLRAASQMVSYEVAMGMSLLGVFLIYGSLQLQPMVAWQRENAWGIFVQPFAFFLFLAASCAETKRIPFDQPEGESEIVAGYFVEYSGLKWLMFMIGEYMELISSSAILVTLFFGGHALPFLHRDGITVAFGGTTLFVYKMNHLAFVIISIITFFTKTLLMIWVQIFFRFTLPRFRYDQLMKLGWTRLLPFAIGNMLVTGVLLLAIDGAGPELKSALKVLADVTQGIVAFGCITAFVVIIVGLLEPVERKRILQSTAVRFATALGGTKASTQQA